MVLISGPTVMKIAHTALHQQSGLFSHVNISVIQQLFGKLMAKVTVAMLGARRHYAVPRLLHEAGLLARFYTDSYIGNKPWLEAVLKSIPASLRPRSVQRWLGRKDAILPPDKVISFETLGFWYAWAQRRAQTMGQMEAIYRDGAVRFSKRVLSAGFGDAELLWGFNGASLELFTAGKARGLRCILEQTILPRRLELDLLREEVERWPDWESGLEVLPDGSIISAWEEREKQEWALADRVVAGSEFVRSGLVKCGVPAKKIRVVPYGVDTRHFSSLSTCSSDRRNGVLRVLFVGQVGLRKGIPDLLQALGRFGSGELDVRIAGFITQDAGKLERAGKGVRFLGPVPRSDMRHLYQWADVFVLPSIVEGSATVTYEALAMGLPVITTLNAGSLVQDGVDGFIVPIREPDALAEALRRYQADRILLARHRAATAESCTRVGVDRYRTDLTQLVAELSSM